MKKIDAKYYARWNKDYEAAKSLLEGKLERMEQLHDELERDLEIIGATAIEDRLQDEVRMLFVTQLRSSTK